MTVKEFKKMDICKRAKNVNYFDVNGKNISSKPSFILDLLQVIGTGHRADGSIDVDVDYME